RRGIVLERLMMRIVVRPHWMKRRFPVEGGRRIGMEHVSRSASSGLEGGSSDARRLTQVVPCSRDRQSERIVAEPAREIVRIGGVLTSRRGGAEAAMEPAPADALFVEQIADVLAGELDSEGEGIGWVGGGGAAFIGAAIVEIRIKVRDQRARLNRLRPT